MRKSAYESDRTLTTKRFALRLHLGFAEVARAVHPVAIVREKRSDTTEDDSRAIGATVKGDACRHSFRMREVEEDGTGNCEMV